MFDALVKNKSAFLTYFFKNLRRYYGAMLGRAMNRRMPQEELVKKISHYGSSSRERAQVTKRSKELLPTYLQQVKHSQSPQFKGAKALRNALNSEDYRKQVELYLNLLGQTMEARIQLETHRMLFQARQSLRRFHL